LAIYGAVQTASHLVPAALGTYGVIHVWQFPLESVIYNPGIQVARDLCL